MSFLYQPGDLAQTPLAALLLEALNLHVTGVLLVEHGGGVSKLFIREGVPVGAQVYVGFKPLGQFLLSRGLIDFESLEKSLQEMARTSRPQGQLLVEMGVITPAALESALSEQQTGYLAIIASLESGGYRFDPDVPIPEWTGGIKLSPLKSIVDALEKPQAVGLVGAALRQVAGRSVALSTGYAKVSGWFGWSPEELALVEKLEQPVALEVFFADARLPPERARAVMAALLLLGRAEPSDGPKTSSLENPAEAAAEPSAAASKPREAAGTPSVASLGSQTAPAARSDPAEARARRQRLLTKAMQNMGIGPLASRGAPSGAPSTATQESKVPAAPAEESGARLKPKPAEAELRRALTEIAPRALAKDLFERLGVERSATPAQVKQAYLSLAKQFHPDRFLGAALIDLAPQVRDMFAAINEAYEVLSDEKKRTAYLARTQGAGDTAPLGDAQLDFRKGDACLKSRDFARARGFFEAAIRQHPRAEYQAALAWCLLIDPAHQDREKAKELVAEALKDASCDRACYVAAILAREDGDEERAERLFKAALKANPKHLEAEREIRLIEMRRQKTGGSSKRK